MSTRSGERKPGSTYLWRKIGSEESRDFKRKRPKSAPRIRGPDFGEARTEPMSEDEVQRLYAFLVSRYGGRGNIPAQRFLDDLSGSLQWEALARQPREGQQGRLILLQAVEHHCR